MVPDRWESFESISNSRIQHAFDDASLNEDTKSRKSVTRDSPWHPGIFRHVPWMGITSLCGALLCIVASCATVLFSNNQLTSSWRVQPSFLLALSSAGANTLLGFAFAVGAEISWWRTALKGSTIIDLHQQWRYGVSVWASLSSFRYSKSIVLASVFASIAVIDSPLLQRASSIVSEARTTNLPVVTDIVHVIPEGFTGIGSSYSNTVDLFTPTFAGVVKDFSNKVAIDVSDWHCNNTCTGYIIGAGLKPECKQSINSSFSISENIAPPYQTLLSVDFDFMFWQGVMLSAEVRAGIYIQMETVFANTAALQDGICHGSSVRTICKLMPAVLNYTVRIENNILSLKDDARNPSVVSLSNLTYDDTKYTFDYPGISHAAQMLYGSSVQTSTSFPDGYDSVNVSGATSQNYLKSSSNSYGIWSCAYNFSDPTDDMLTNIHELMFRTALSAGSGNSTFEQKIMLQQTKDELVFKSHFEYLAGAVGLMFVTLTLVACTYRGWWQLGRKMTLSPIEIARAYNAPLLLGNGISANADVELLLEKIGGAQVRYGEVVNDTPGAQRGNLGFGLFENVQRPGLGGVYLD
ncbi:hypothetical protein N7456_010339 [Penicillium angulare]|uniref:Uncharacterized protein n=1 Tax=Penicillium angulare TaxID=116970 RepID=A0A9W9F6F0_9EURO|nr:hypothetical protein N7456_010339 [Penicillium angulare]